MCVGNNSAYPWASPLRGQRKRCSKRLAVLSGNSNYFRVYTKRDYRDGLPDKAEWGQGIIATFESGFTQGPVGFGVDCIAQYAVRLNGGRGPSGLRLD
ncbi:outer membrane porin, OprD family [Klebsiella pneumoniae]|nr:outer membrane porin, OprD family [Klebsiella pneumoniae]